MVLTFESMGDRAICIRGVDRPGLVAQALRLRGLDGVEDVVAAFDALALYFQPGALPSEEAICEWLESTPVDETVNPQRWVIPVDYSMGLDLPDVADRLGLRPDDVIELHAAREVEVLATGFRPGFAYCGLIAPELQGIPRRETPRRDVGPGAVAIANDLTAVYPQPGPGGWAIIGRTPLTLPTGDGGSALMTGDVVRYEPINPATFDELHLQPLRPDR